MAPIPFLDAAHGRATSHTPVWFMRQAGRSLPEYRALRGEGSILDAIKRPDLSTELTLQPVRRHHVDAAVLYSDIVVPAHAIGFGIDVAPGTGPVASQPFRSAADLGRVSHPACVHPASVVFVTTPIDIEAGKGACNQGAQAAVAVERVRIARRLRREYGEGQVSRRKPEEDVERRTHQVAHPVGRSGQTQGETSGTRAGQPPAE